MGRLEDIVERNKHPRKHRRGALSIGIGLAIFVLVILVLMIFTDLDESPSPSPSVDPEPGRVRGIELRVEHRDARPD